MEIEKTEMEMRLSQLFAYDTAKALAESVNELLGFIKIPDSDKESIGVKTRAETLQCHLVEMIEGLGTGFEKIIADIKKKQSCKNK